MNVRAGNAVDGLPYRLAFLDIDGTLIGGDGQMSDRVHAAVQRSQSAGCTLVLCTGRTRHAAEKVIQQLGGDGISIVLNGALVYNWKTAAVLRRALLPVRVTRTAIALAHRAGMAPVWLGTEETSPCVYSDSLCPLWPRYLERNHARIVVTSNLAVEMPGRPASIAAYGTRTAAESLSEAWRCEFGASAVSVAGPTAAYEAWYAQLTAGNADKRHAAKAVARAMKIPRNQVLALGDHQNDAELLRWAGLGVCMGGGDPSAIAAADFVTGAMDEDGAAYVLERFILSRERL